MFEAQFVAYYEYGPLASRFANLFRQKWLQGREPPNDSLLGTGDLRSLGGLASSYQVLHSMRLFPFGRALVVRLAILIALPLLPLILTMIPLEELLRRLVKLLL